MARARVSSENKTTLHLWKELIGYDQDFLRLNRLVDKDSLPPVILFYGKDGMGKRAFVQGVAALFFCQSRNACGNCPSCLMVAKGQHPDVLTITSSGTQMKLDDIKPMFEHLSTHGVNKRVAILYDVDLANLQSMNMLLKVLEEPAEDGVVFLTTAKKYLLLPTLLSRCVVWHLRPPSKEATRAYIKEWLPPNADTISGEALEIVEKRCGYAIGKILQYLSQEEKEGIHGNATTVVSKILEGKSLEKMLDQVSSLGTNKSVGLTQYIQEIEFALNQIYKKIYKAKNYGEKIEIPTPNTLWKRRARLKKIKEIAMRNKTSLNQTLALEGIALEGYQ